MNLLRKRFIIRWKEQGSKDVHDAQVMACNEKDALCKLRDNLLLTCGIGYNYLWIIKVSTDTYTTLYVKKVNDVIDIIDTQKF